MEQKIKKFTPLGGKHCITNALKQVFSYYGYPMTEEMIFGIASGLVFTYINLAYSPMISGRTKPFDFEEKLAERLNIRIKCKKPKSYSIAFSQTKKMIDEAKPVLVYTDMPFLKYLGLDENSHFGGHAVVLFGYDEERQIFYVSDRDNCNYPIRTPRGDIAEDYHIVSYDEMLLARNSHFRPFPANNKYLEFDFTGFTSIVTDVITSAINETCESMLNPPANLLGLNGIMKFSKEIVKWSKYDNQKLKVAGITNYFQISKDGGTGGGIFRKMYGQFLIEANTILVNKGLGEIGSQYISLAEEWDLLANSMWILGETGDKNLLKSMNQQIIVLYKKEKSLLEQLQSSIK